MQDTKLRRTFVIIHILLMVLASPIMVFVIEFGSNPHPENLVIMPLLGSLLVCFLLEVAMIGLLPYHSIGLILCYLLSLFFSLINYFLLQARDIPFMAMDVYEVGTALSVAGDYSYKLSSNLIISIILVVGICILVLITHRAYNEVAKRHFTLKKNLLVGLSGAGCLFLLIYFVSFAISFNMVLDLWKPGVTYSKNSALTSFISFAQFSVVAEPEGYEKDEIAKVLEEAQREYDGKYHQISDGQKPTVIAIMDEAFGDLSVLGDIECVDEHLAYYKSLANDPGTIWHGYAYTSTYGGGTARSEFEWLTGYSMNMFANAQPYSQFNFTDIMTCVDSFKEDGYQTIALHPEKATNYRRNSVYEDMGFDLFLSKPDFVNFERSDLVYSRISDWGCFDKIISLDEEEKGPKFFHNVTMQNHGGYTKNVDKNKLVEVDSEYEKYPTLVLYESFISRTDSAIEKLIEYYKESDSPTIICLYGDHLPSIEQGAIDALYESVGEKELEENTGDRDDFEKRFMVPFFVWANYDVLGEIKPCKKDDHDVTSLNFLGAVTRAYSGKNLSAFDKYLVLLQEIIPVINESGYYADGKWYTYSEESKYKKYMDEYAKIQYAGMFDSEGLEQFFQ